MKKDGTSLERDARPGDAGESTRRAGHAAAPVQVNVDGRTRHEVARLLLERGPIAAVAVAEGLGISPTAVRRHLDALVGDGEAETRDAPRRGPRGRGRPAKAFLLTEAGRARFGHAYDDLAVSAIRFLAEHAGPEAVRAFAERRVAALVGPHRDSVLRQPDPEARAKALATVLSKEGYAASTRQIGAGEQLCQHHCPVAHVAAEFPQLCEAETEAFAELLGTHVQRLATIARGDSVCTTHVPAAPAGSPDTGHSVTRKPGSARPGRTGSPSDGSDAASANGGHPA